MLRRIWKTLDYVGKIYPIATHRYRYTHDSIRRHDSIMLIVRSLKELTNTVVPFFDHYELHGNKRRNYELWKTAVNIMEQGGHHTPHGLQKITEIKSQMNKYLDHDEIEPASDAPEKQP